MTALGCQSRLRQTGPALGLIVPGLSHRNKALFIKKKNWGVAADHLPDGSWPGLRGSWPKGAFPQLRSPPVVREGGTCSGLSALSELQGQDQVPGGPPEKLDLFRCLVTERSRGSGITLTPETLVWALVLALPLTHPRTLGKAFPTPGLSLPISKMGLSKVQG